ncbi:hypothetical protein [Escherichia coli]|uniref:Hypothetical phage protein n=1 Tax=Escherichia coli (strain SE11) TaxID=409438 RepID=A0A979GGB5_ECOSE|nr:hypothetical protein [Escherichia coli]BAG78121.1 hypothetical phage protein [Escherichia coli SE11]
MFKRFCYLLPNCLPVMLLALILIISLFYGLRALLFWNAAVFSVALCFTGTIFDDLSRTGKIRRYASINAIDFLGGLVGLSLSAIATGLLEEAHQFTIYALSGFCSIWFCFRLHICLRRSVPSGAEA